MQNDNSIQLVGALGEDANLCLRYSSYLSEGNVYTSVVGGNGYTPSKADISRFSYTGPKADGADIGDEIGVFYREGKGITAIQKYKLELIVNGASNGNGTLTVTRGNGSIETIRAGESITLDRSKDEDYAPISYSVVSEPAVGRDIFYFHVKGGDLGNIMNQPSFSEENIASSRQITINFTSKKYTIGTTVSPSEGGTVNRSSGTSNSTYTHGNSVTLTASPAAGYSFVNWTDDDNNGAVVSTSPSFTIDSIEKNYHLTANFTKAYTITASADPTEGGTVTGGGTYAQGEDVTLTATPNRGWNFIQWDVQPDGPVVTENPWAFQASEDLTATATFEKIPAAYQPEDIVDTTVPGGTVTLTDANDNGVIEYDEKVTITVTPDTGSIFEKWVDKDGNEFSKDTTLTFDPADYDSQLPIKPVYSNDPTYIPDQDGDGQPEDGTGKEYYPVSPEAGQKPDHFVPDGILKDTDGNGIQRRGGRP
ncbi:MAG: InlB B-repeat-containing protein [Clostridia bacterium]|nr:InlB B-repeat-containing protein [Clostridia bacterium]